MMVLRHNDIPRHIFYAKLLRRKECSHAQNSSVAIDNLSGNAS